MDDLTESALALLRRDGRAGFSEIARELGSTRAEISRRIAPLLEDGTFKVVAALRPELLGLNAFGALRIKPRGAAPGLAQRLCAAQDAVFVSETTGAHRFTAEFHCADLAALHARIALVRSWDDVAEVQPIVYESMLSSFFVDGSGAPALPRLDHHDLALLGALRGNGRATFEALAEASGLSPSAARARTLRLRDSGAVRIGLVRGRSADPGEAVLGFGLVAAGPLEGLTRELRGDPRLEFLAQTLGSFDATGTLTLPGAAAVPSVLERLHSLARLHHVETWLHVRVHLEAYR